MDLKYLNYTFLGCRQTWKISQIFVNNKRKAQRYDRGNSSDFYFESDRTSIAKKFFSTFNFSEHLKI